MKEIASCNDCVICERGHEIVIARRPGGVGPTVLFVLALVAFILGANGVFQLVEALRGRSPWPLPLVMLTVAALLAGGFVLALRKRRRDAAAPLVPELVIDAHRGVLLDPLGQLIAPLAQVQFERQLQLGSSSSALACRWPAGVQIIARGNPFGESIDDVADTLARVTGRA
jgi:hypothetical protein